MQKRCDKTKRLKLHKQTIQILTDPQQLQQAIGGATTHCSWCGGTAECCQLH